MINNQDTAQIEEPIEDVINDIEDSFYVDEDSYYNDENEDFDDMDDSAWNYSQIPDNVAEEDDGEDLSAASGQHVSVFKLLIKILCNPVEGWKDLRRKKIGVEEAQRNCFYPLLALMALSHMATLFYSSGITLSQVILEAVISFVSYFAGYFCIVLLLNLLLPGEARNSMDTTFGKVFVIMNLSSLCLFFTAMELFPMLWPVLIFLPLWTVYVICRGVRFFKFQEQRTIYCISLMCLLIIGIPTLLEYGLGEVLPADFE